MMIGRCSPTAVAVTPSPMPMLVVAAVDEAAMANPSTTPRLLRRAVGACAVPGGSSP